ncbi:hypothetical protein GJ700_29400 [Duganella sp. FT92W]|uniref:Uncharacterized protein n=1 Tax=Pseudoduganella rivuli TaxID=2666085 RepID=A0A7X2ITI2_9BURK|nr:hypothetical protein [Pseudoduganella rivuli]MRV75835.1 hypothetical protein [Pseudoduganella rivuli]
MNAQSSHQIVGNLDGRTLFYSKYRAQGLDLWASNRLYGILPRRDPRFIYAIASAVCNAERADHLIGAGASPNGRLALPALAVKKH